MRKKRFLQAIIGFIFSGGTAGAFTYLPLPAALPNIIPQQKVLPPVLPLNKKGSSFPLEDIGAIHRQIEMIKLVDSQA